ncbi:MAG: glycosyltransferase family 4 protein [Bacteroidales bacterium]|nr:glycosyltransferase family 4 protein [Bacteroidales bacterium]
MKIAYCLDEINSIGGIERVTIAKANALSRIDGNEVFLLVAFRGKEKPALKIAPAVSVIYLGVKYDAPRSLSRLREILFILRTMKEHKRKLEQCLNRIAPDVVISVGMSEKHLLQKKAIASNPVLIREFHFPLNYRQKQAESLFEKGLALAGDFWERRRDLKNYDKIVSLTEEDLVENWHRDGRIAIIPNPLPSAPSRVSNLNNKVVITAGRLVRQKNYSSLISAWRYVNERHPDWKLKIFGEGGLQAKLRAQIDNAGLSASVQLCGTTHHILEEMADSSIFVLSSLFEGLPLSILEAMACGLPVVSYACPCGPKDIISDGKDGFLVDPGDEKGLALRLSSIIEDEALRYEMGRAAKAKSVRFSPEIISEKWMALFNELKYKEQC